MDDRWRGATHQLLEYATSIARGGSVVVAFPDAEPHVLGPCVAAFNEELTYVADDARVRSWFWTVGVNQLGAAARARCGRFSQCSASKEARLTPPGSRSAGGRAAGTRPGCPGPCTPTGICWIPALRGWRYGSHCPACTKQSPKRSASTWRRRSTLVRTDGVELGAFRGPTLHLTDRWIAVEPLLAATVGTSLAAFVLARKAEMALRASAPGDMPTGVLQVGSILRPPGPQSQ